jgi:hypothetical protein
VPDAGATSAVFLSEAKDLDRDQDASRCSELVKKSLVDDRYFSHEARE